MPTFLLNRKYFLIGLIVLVHLLFSYYYIPRYFSAAIGSVLIISLALIIWKKDGLYWIGLKISGRQIFYSVAAFICFFIGSYLIINFIAHKNGVQIFTGNYKDVVHTLFYTLNEEIVIGALLLKGIRQALKKTPDWIISVAAAFVFAIIHLVFFKWVFINRGDLGAITLLSLFAVGIFRNNLILKTGHVGFSWAIHFAWVYVMLGSQHLINVKEYYLSDFERFEMYLGDVRILGACVVLVMFSFLIRKTPISSE